MVVPPNLEISLPDTEGTNFVYDNGVMRMDTSITIRNNGYYFGGFAITHDITNFTVSVLAQVEDIEVANTTSDPVDIPMGSSRLVPVSIAINLAPLISTGYIVFEPANVSFTIGGGATTTRGLLSADASVTLSIPMEEPLISDFNLDFQNSTFSNVTGGVEWRLPYTIVTADFLPGNASAAFTILNETGGFVGNATELIPLGQSVASNLTLFVTDESFLELMARPQNLTLQFELTLPGNLTFTRQITIPWEPPGGG